MTQDEIAGLDPATVAQAIDIPLSRWPGNCYAIATQMIRHRVVDGFAVYGHYYGPIADASPFFHRATGIVRHGWIETADGLLIDPTRFVFEACGPYISCERRNKVISEYDEGGERLRRALQERKPAPAFDPSAKQFQVPVAARAAISLLVGRSQDALSITFAEAFWVANLPYSTIEQDATTIYEALDAMGQQALVPIDNRLRAQRPPLFAR